MKHQNLYTVRIENGKSGMNIFLAISGVEHYLTTYRSNGVVWQKLKNGMTLGELKRLKPQKSRAGQVYFHSVRHILKIANDYIKYELVA
jgi:hypothetical protein